MYRLVKIWDYHSKSCVQTLESHTANVSFAIFHPSLPIILSGSEDGTIKIWHSSTYRLENTLSYGLERAWCVAYRKSGNEVAVGFDEGAVVVKVRPLLIHSGKLISLSSVAMNRQFQWTRRARLSMPVTRRS
jgi:WD40 repeat protein